MLGEDGRGRKHGEEARWVRPGDAVPRRGGAMGAPRRRRSVARRRDGCAQETPIRGEEARWVRPGDAVPGRGGARWVREAWPGRPEAPVQAEERRNRTARYTVGSRNRHGSKRKPTDLGPTWALTH